MGSVAHGHGCWGGGGELEPRGPWGMGALPMHQHPWGSHPVVHAGVHIEFWAAPNFT